MVCYTDADLSANLAQLGSLAAPVVAGDKVAGALGQRYGIEGAVLVRADGPVTEPHSTGDKPDKIIILFRHFVRALLIPSLAHVLDTQAGFKAFDGAALGPVIRQMTSFNETFDVELLIHLAQHYGPRALAVEPIVFTEDFAATNFPSVDARAAPPGDGSPGRGALRPARRTGRPRHRRGGRPARPDQDARPRRLCDLDRAPSRRGRRRPDAVRPPMARAAPSRHPPPLTPAMSIPSAGQAGGMDPQMLRCGVAAGPVFIAVFLLEGAVRDGYRPLRHPVSSLALGSRGWIQAGNFAVTGTLFLAGAAGLARAGDPASSSRAAPALIGGAGVGLICSAIFPTDPVSGYPRDSRCAHPGQPCRHRAQSGGPPRVLRGSRRGPRLRLAVLASGQRGFGLYSAGTAITMLATMALAAAGFGQSPRLVNLGGLLQRASIITGFAWLTALSARALQGPPAARGRRQELVRMTSCWVARVIAT